MRRFAIFLLLTTLVLPYAHAPLCEAGSHEHAEHRGMKGMPALAEAPGESADAGADCHSLMGCAVVLQASLPAAAAVFRALPHRSDASRPGAVAQLRSRASPDTPPPKTV